MAKIDIFSSMLHSAILDRDPEMFADEFYDTGKVLQFELYGDEGEETLTERVFHKGSGSHSGGFWNFEGERYSFHISCSQEVEDLHFEPAPVVNSSSPVNTVAVASTEPENNEASSNADSLNADLKHREWDLILDAIRKSRGSRKATAERLGISQRTLRYKLARMREAGLAIPDGTGLETA